MAGVSAGGGEVPIVVSEDQCVLLEDETPMQSSLIWTLLENYYKHMALEAWTHNYVPMFVSSNSRLCKGYATVVFSFLKDYYAKHKEGPVYILELGAGHGRFTYLFLRHLVKLQPLFAAFGMPERPFVVVFTDVAEANVDFVSKHEAMQEFIDAGWLDFACLDCNLPGCSGPSDVAVDLRISGETLRPGTPCVVIANYVFDSLNTDAFQISPEGSVRQCTVKVFSSQEESDPEDCSVLSRMSLKFGWRCLEFPPMEATETSFYLPYGGAQELLYPPSAAVGPNVLKRSVLSKPPVIEELPPTVPLPEHLRTPSVQYILNYYRNLAVQQHSWLSFTVPVGAIRFVMTMKAFSQSKFLLLVGDKGYPDAEEFTVRKDPHIAVHGSLSFMVNLHAIRLAWEGSESQSVVTPYKDCFQVTIFDGLGDTPNMSQSICDMHDYLVPDSLLRIHKLTTEPAVTDTATIAQLMATVRLSCHDPEVFVSIRKPLLAAMSGAGVRQEYDVVRDCYEVNKHFFRLHEGDLFPEIAGMACMKAGRLGHAINFFGDYLKYCPISCRASVLVNSASCYKALNNLPKALEFANEALEIVPGYQPALEIERSIQMQTNPFRLGVLGYSDEVGRMILPMLRMDSKVQLVAICTPSATCRQNYRALEASLVGQSEDLAWQHFDESNAFLDYCVEAGIAAVVLCTEQSTLVDHVEACFRRGLSVLSDRIRYVQAEPRKLLQRFANENERRQLKGLTRLAWHTLSLFPYEDVAVALRLRLGAVGKLHSVSATFSCHPESSLEHETVKVFRTVSFALDDAHLASVFCRAGPLDENGKAARLSGIFQLQSKSGLVAVTFVVAHTRALPVREFTFLGEQGHVTLKQAGPSWNLKVHTPGEIRAEPFPISAVQNALYTFLSQLYKNEGSLGPPSVTSKSSLRLATNCNAETVTCCVHRSVEDSLVEHTFHTGLQSSLEREGACVCYSLAAC